jgi:hypothetical protein
MDDLRQSIQKTLSYFDLFDCPMTKEELYRFLWDFQEPLSFETFSRRVDTMIEGKETSFKFSRGYFFLVGREKSIADRERRVWFIEKKLSIARKAAWFLRFVPGVKAFFVCNQIQIGVSKKSDIDVLIVVENGQIFTTRFFVTVLLGLFRLRRGKKKVTDRICLSFYVTENSLDFSKLQVGESDIYFHHWIATLIPVFDPENFLQKIYNENRFVEKKLPFVFQKAGYQKWMVSDSKCSLFLRKTKEKILRTRFGFKLEIFFKKIQLSHMQKNTNSVQNQDTRVIVSDTMLKFHENDRRELFQTEWKKRWNV